MVDAMMHRPFNPVAMSQTHRDITDDKYRDLRRPRRIGFYCNGDRYFKVGNSFIIYVCENARNMAVLSLTLMRDFQQICLGISMLILCRMAELFFLFMI